MSLNNYYKNFFEYYLKRLPSSDADSTSNELTANSNNLSGSRPLTVWLREKDVDENENDGDEEEGKEEEEKEEEEKEEEKEEKEEKKKEKANDGYIEPKKLTKQFHSPPPIKKPLVAVAVPEAKPVIKEDPFNYEMNKRISRPFYIRFNSHRAQQPNNGYLAPLSLTNENKSYLRPLTSEDRSYLQPLMNENGYLLPQSQLNGNQMATFNEIDDDEETERNSRETTQKPLLQNFYTTNPFKSTNLNEKS